MILSGNRFTNDRLSLRRSLRPPTPDHEPYRSFISLVTKRAQTNIIGDGASAAAIANAKSLVPIGRRIRFLNPPTDVSRLGFGRRSHIDKRQARALIRWTRWRVCVVTRAIMHKVPGANHSDVTSRTIPNNRTHSTVRIIIIIRLTRRP